ncbi:hypothetical protein BKA70DRAFT_1229581 [Coprinopsis sp. MPI-PUGE-AT-0042]|nr:hypothetical protein BKA70DRAFT_1229581 [Coprinopsis sp. MPI-PUGE-AT-0042]
MGCKPGIYWMALMYKVVPVEDTFLGHHAAGLRATGRVTKAPPKYYLMGTGFQHFHEIGAGCSTEFYSEHRTLRSPDCGHRFMTINLLWRCRERVVHPVSTATEALLKMSDPSPERVKQLEFYGKVVSQSNYATTTLTFVAVGISWFMVIYGISTFFETPKEHRKGRAKFLWISFAICVLFSADASRGAWAAYEYLYLSGPNGWDSPGHSCNGTSLLYRAFVIWSHRKWLLIPPALTISTHIVIAILSPIQIPSISNKKSSLAVILLNISTNIMITSLIIARLVQTRQRMASALPDSKKQPMYSDVVAMLVESATPLAVFGLLCAISQSSVRISQVHSLRERDGRGHVLLSHYSTTRSVWVLSPCPFMLEGIPTNLYITQALSPQMVIFRVTNGRSWSRPQQTVDGAAVFSRPIQFAQTTLKSPDTKSLDVERRS